ncbi:MAG: LamG-like jellyroll fold domain-containing protein, partial [Phycisphaerales bacterium]
SSANQGLHYRISAAGGLRMGLYSFDLDLPAGKVRANTWYHLTFRYDFESQNRKVYVNGVLTGEGAAAPYLGTAGDTLVGTFWRPDRADRVPEWFNGMIDDVQVYDRALTDAEIQEIMLGLTDPSLAYDPVPADGSVDVPRDAALGWSAGDSAVTHDVYLGTSRADVNDAGRTDPRGVLVSQDQTEIGYDPAGLLDFDTTYYWRIDEVGGAPDNATSKGDVWSFTTEPYAYPIAGLTVQASAEEAASPAIRTIDGSGLDEFDQHGVDLKTMWVTSGGLPAWIQYTFDKEYKLTELWVWNANSELETFTGFGAKDVVIEYSTDGETWTPLENVPEFAQGAGNAGYMANTIIDLGEVMARHVKLTINDDWGETGTVSLSEVRFFYKPVQAFAPRPEGGAVGIGVETDLAWRPGREATSHVVYIGADRDAVADGAVSGDTVANPGYTPADLILATEYFWRVDEVGDSGTYAGDVWSFTTEQYAVIDDFESYTDDIDAGETIYQAWIDGVTNGSGSYVGYENSKYGTFGETVIVHAGSQSMPVTYDNTKSPYYSEAERTFDSPQDWTAHGADTLSLYFRGIATNSAEGLYVTVKDNSKSKTVAHSNAAAATLAEWRQWTIPLSEFTASGVKVTAVKGLAIGVGNRAAPTTGGAGIVYIDDIGYGRPLQ